FGSFARAGGRGRRRGRLPGGGVVAGRVRRGLARPAGFPRFPGGRLPAAVTRRTKRSATRGGRTVPRERAGNLAGPASRPGPLPPAAGTVTRRHKRVRRAGLTPLPQVRVPPGTFRPGRGHAGRPDAGAPAPGQRARLQSPPSRWLGPPANLSGLTEKRTDDR